MPSNINKQLCVDVEILWHVTSNAVDVAASIAVVVAVDACSIEISENKMKNFSMINLSNAV